jgi:hypothetical protein
MWIPNSRYHRRCFVVWQTLPRSGLGRQAAHIPSYLLVLPSDCTRGRWAAGSRTTVCAEGGERGPLL